MALTEQDLDALRVLMAEELDARLKPLRAEIREQFSEVQAQFDGLYKRDETREEEYLVIRGQVGRVEERVEKLERKVG